jgi:hypothetical protein
VIFLIAFLILPSQLYGSSISCDPTVNLTNQTNCRDRSSSSSNSESKDDLQSDEIETPLLLPDISPTREDLNNVESDDSVKITDSEDVKNNVEINSDNDEQSEGVMNNKDSDENNEDDSGDESTVIPFP